jgi:hypothetical protein
MRALCSKPTLGYGGGKQTPRTYICGAILRELGRGGMGVVYLARNKLMGRPDAHKVGGGHLVERSEVRDRFLREVQSAAKLQGGNQLQNRDTLRNLRPPRSRCAGLRGGHGPWSPARPGAPGSCSGSSFSSRSRRTASRSTSGRARCRASRTLSLEAIRRAVPNAPTHRPQAGHRRRPPRRNPRARHHGRRVTKRMHGQL